MPDEELLRAAVRNTLRNPPVLEAPVRRMMKEIPRPRMPKTRRKYSSDDNRGRIITPCVPLPR
jgi:hypothetical protein